MPLRPKAKLKAWRRKVARPRVNQFADDLGISRREALSLMEQGRRRKDGGSNVLENSMNKMKGYKEGGSKEVPLPKKKPAEPKRIALPRPKIPEPGSDVRSYGEDTTYNIYEEKMASGGSMKVKGYSDGGSCRGAGKAIQGTKFRGVR